MCVKICLVNVIVAMTTISDVNKSDLIITMG